MKRFKKSRFKVKASSYHSDSHDKASYHLRMPMHMGRKSARSAYRGGPKR